MTSASEAGSESKYVLRSSHVRPAGMLIAPVEGLMLGEALRFGRALCLRRVFAIQLDIWLMERPVWAFKFSFSSSVGYGWSMCSTIQSFRIFVQARGNRAAAAPFLGRLSPRSSSSMGPTWPRQRICFLPVRPPNNRSSFSATMSNVSSAVLDFCMGIFSGSLKLHGRHRALQGEQPDTASPRELL